MAKEITEEDVKEQLTAEELQNRKHFIKRLFIAGIVLLVLAAGIWFMIGFMLRYTTRSRMESMVSRAHTFANVVHEWTDRGKAIESGIYRVDQEDGEFNQFVVYYFGDFEGEWFGLVLDDTGAVKYTMYSKVEIPEEYLQNPPDYEEQYALLDSYFSFRRKKTIAVWKPETAKGEESD